MVGGMDEALIRVRAARDGAMALGLASALGIV